MHTRIFRGLISAAILLVLVIGCSSQNQSKTPVSSDLPAVTGGEKQDAGDITRGAMTVYDIHTNDPCTTAQTHFSDEGLGDYNTTSTDCIAGTYYKPSSTYYNYILACDTQYKWDANWASYERVRLYRLTSADTPAVSNTAVIPGTYLKDPDGCDLINVGSYLYAFVSDGTYVNVRLYYWSLNADGSLVSATPTYARQFSHADMDHVQGVAATITNSTSNYHVFVCDPNDQKLFIFDQDGNSVEFSGGADYYSFPSGDKPIDVCITRYSTSNWIAYVAVRGGADGNNDYIRCFKWDGTDYDTNSDADCTSGGSDKFPMIMSLSVLKCGISSSSEEHNDGDVTVLTYDTDDFRGYYLRQINFGSGNDYYQFSDEFDSVNEEIDGGIASESLALCKQYYTSGNTYFGYHYILTDRDGDLNYTGDYDGDNILVYNNDQT